MTTLAAQATAFQNAVESNNLTQASTLLTSLKLQLISLPSLPPTCMASPSAIAERLLARTVLEWSTLYSLQCQDMTGFERHFAQLKIYYTDFEEELQPSSLQYVIMGVRLLQYLIETRMSDFHGLLELIPDDKRNDVNIAYAIKMEQWMMEGSYSKALEARDTAPSAHWKPVLDKLLETVRDAIAECMGVAYTSLTLKQAETLLIFKEKAAVLGYITENQPTWIVKGDTVSFKAPKRGLQSKDIPSMRLVEETLTYAMELDRIV